MSKRKDKDLITLLINEMGKLDLEKCAIFIAAVVSLYDVMKLYEETAHSFTIQEKIKIMETLVKANKDIKKDLISVLKIVDESKKLRRASHEITY